MFTPIVQDHFYNPRNVGPLPEATHQGTAGMPGDGPYMLLWFQVDGDRILRAAYRTYPCPAATACGSMTAALATGRSVAQILQLTAEDLTRALGGLPEGKEHCPALAIQALARALDA